MNKTAYTDIENILRGIVVLMNSLELTTVVNTLANAIACKLTIDETALLASVLVQLGDTLATIATRESFCLDKN